MHFDFLIPVVYNDQDITFNDGLGRVLEGRGAKVAYLVHTRYGERAMRERHEHVFFLYEGYDQEREPSEAELSALEKKYDLGSLRDFVYPESVVPATQPREILFRRALHVFRFLERFCEEHQVDSFLNNLGPELVRRVMFRIRDNGGPQNLVLDFAPIHGRLTVTTDEIHWDELPKELPVLTAAERAEMVAYVEGATTAKKPFYPPNYLKIRPQNVVNAFKYARRFFAERSDVRYGALVYQRFESLARVRAAKVLFEQPVPGERFYFFPLHLSDDSAITVRAPQFQRQEEIVRYIAERALPLGTKLYVKPHPAAMHAYSLGTLHEISRIPNVRLIDPPVVSHELIAAAEGVCVINSTVGFESLLYGKPVLSLGRCFYRGFGITTDVDQLADVPRALARAVASPPDMELVYRFLHACFQATHPGHLAAQTPENFELLANALMGKLERLRRSGAGAAAAPPVSSLSS